MLVEQIYLDNDYRNFNYLVACGETGDALAIDPLDSKRCLDLAKARGWRISQVLNTHEHGDHTGGNAAVIAATGAKLLAHKNAVKAIEGVDVPLCAGDRVSVGSTVELEALDTPGHTMSHICLLSRGEPPALFSGDTLFNAGAGNCVHGGHPAELYETFAKQLARLPDATRIYPGHDYLANNLRFTLDREPNNAKARELLDRAETQDPHHPLVTTLGLEKEINTFFRLKSSSVIAALRAKNPRFPETPSDKDVFLALRELRNTW